MSNLRNKLIEYIEAYAIAKNTNNVILVSLSTNALLGLIDSMDFVQKAGELEDEADGFEAPEDTVRPEKPRNPRKTTND